MQPDAIAARLDRLRAVGPLVHNITNYVVMNNTANALLAIGASPAMVHAADEVEDFLAISSALVVNIGTLSSGWVASMRLAALAAGRLGKPWVLDPVGVGATRFRTRVSGDLLALGPTAVRGNASEIIALAGTSGETPKGVDSTRGADEAEDVAGLLAQLSGAVIAVTGVVDVVTDGQRLARIEGGHALMARVTGLGCSATALVGAFLGADPSAPFEATVAALAVFGAAGGLAAEGAAGPGSLQLRLLDALYTMDEATIAAHSRVTLA